MNYAKKTIATATLGAVLLTTGIPAAFAQPKADKGNNGHQQNGAVTTVAQKPVDKKANEYELVINGTALYHENQKLGGYNNGEFIMVPLRAIVDELGGTVNWDGKTKSLTVQIGAFSSMLKEGVDGYTINKTAPMTLGKAPEKQRGTTYVPLQFFTEIVGMNCVQNGNKIELGEKHVVENLSITGTIEEVQADGALRIKGTGAYSDIILRANDQTVLLDAKGNKIKLDQFKQGAQVKAEFGPAVTRSMPPQGTAIKIQLVDQQVAALPTMTGTIKEVTPNGIWVTNTNTTGFNQLILLIDKDTKITKDGKVIKASDLKAGMTVTGTHSHMVAMSEPGQSYASLIEVK